MNEYTLPRVDTVLAIAGKNEQMGDTVIKVINSGSEPAKMDVRVPGGKRQARVWELSAASSTDEDLFEEPLKIAPRERTVAAGSSFAYEFPPYSLTILRM